MNKIYKAAKYRMRNKESFNILRQVFVILIIVLLRSGPALAQILVDAASTAVAITNVTSITVTHTTGSNLNRLMLVGVSYREGGSVSSVTYDGDLMELVGSQISSANAKTYIYSMLNPPAGTANVVVTLTGGDFDKGGIVGVMTFSGVDINTPLNTYASALGNSSNPTISNIPTATNQLVFNVVALRQQDLIGVGPSQTALWNIASGDEMRGGGSTKPGDGATTNMSWTSTSGDWSMSAVSIKPTPVANLGILKTVNNATPYIGQSVTFTLTASNQGPDNALNVVVTDLLPSGFTYQEHSTATGTYSGGSGVWNIGTLNNGGTITLTITAVVNSTGSYSNTAAISGDVVDNTTMNDSATQTIIACQAGGTAPLFQN